MMVLTIINGIFKWYTLHKMLVWIPFNNNTATNITIDTYVVQCFGFSSKFCLE